MRVEVQVRNAAPDPAIPSAINRMTAGRASAGKENCFIPRPGPAKTMMEILRRNKSRNLADRLVVLLGIGALPGFS
jgi:hypothetical protein